MLEIIATSVEDAIVIEKGGADRIELVSALSEGGLTPSYGLVHRVIGAVNIPVNVMIRPHSLSFVYSDEDLLCMLEDIKQAKALGANGVVFGMLDSQSYCVCQSEYPFSLRAFFIRSHFSICSNRLRSMANYPPASLL